MYNRLRTRLLPFLLACLALPAQAVVLAESHFDTGSEGWTAGNGVSWQRWNAAGGQAGGYFEARDAGQGEIWVFSAPAAFLGDQTRALGGTLRFWLKTSTLDSPMGSDWSDVKITGSGLQLAIDAGPSPGLGWTFYSVPLAPGAWRIGNLQGPLATASDFRTVFSHIDHLRIRGEFSGALDTGGIDTVILTAVPEPPASWMVLAGLGVLLGWRRRRHG